MSTELSIQQTASIINPTVLASYFPLLHNYSPEHQAVITQGLVNNALQVAPSLPFFKFKMTKGSGQGDELVSGFLYEGNVDKPRQKIALKDILANYRLFFIGAAKVVSLRQDFTDANLRNMAWKDKKNTKNPTVHYTKPVSYSAFQGADFTKWGWVPELKQHEIDILHGIEESSERTAFNRDNAITVLAVKTNGETLDMAVWNLSVTLAGILQTDIKASLDSLCGSVVAPLSISTNAYSNSMLSLFNPAILQQPQAQPQASYSSASFGKAGAEVNIYAKHFHSAQMTDASSQPWVREKEVIGQTQEDAQWCLPFQVIAMVLSKVLLQKIESIYADYMVAEQDPDAPAGSIAVPSVAAPTTPTQATVATPVHTPGYQVVATAQPAPVVDVPEAQHPTAPATAAPTPVAPAPLPAPIPVAPPVPVAAAPVAPIPTVPTVPPVPQAMELPASMAHMLPTPAPTTAVVPTVESLGAGVIDENF